jgi:RHS repeat-associated protein
MGPEPHRFTGKPVSATTGLYYYLHRWYDPSIGRFISPDLKHGHLSNPQSLNLYIYVIDQPTSLTDPTGLDACGWSPLSWGGCINNATQAASNWWNSQDQTTKLAIIAVVATIAIVATAGLAAPALLPLIATGIAIGAGTSAASYAAGTMASGGTITARGLLTSMAIGGFFGAVSFGTYGTVASAATGLGLGSIASFALGSTASLAATALGGLFGPRSSDGISQLANTYVTTSSGRLQAMSQGNVSPACQSGLTYGVGSVAVGGVMVSLGAHSLDVTSDLGSVRYVSYGVIAAGFGLVAIGTAYAVSQCGG